MKSIYLLVLIFSLILGGCSDFSSDTTEFELSGKMYACDGNTQGDIIDDKKAGQKLYCNGYNWINLIPEDSIAQSPSDSENMYECKNGAIVKFESLCSEQINDYLPLDDSEYPYAGIPRIVIETENHREIKDRETEIPAKMQIWGEREPESEIMELTIRGRGNSTWWYPKKPYAIKFSHKQALQGMPSAKNWVLLANYRDRTLIRNAISFAVSDKLNMEWTPKGVFVDLFINGKFYGNYYLCDKINGEKNRLDLKDNDYLLEIDGYYDAENKFRTELKKLPVNIKKPDSLSQAKINSIKKYMDSIECSLYSTCPTKYEDLIDVESFVKYFITFEIANNSELLTRKSVYLHKHQNHLLSAGPVWDFDWVTYRPNATGLVNQEAFWYSRMLYKGKFPQELKRIWDINFIKLKGIPSIIDSLASYTKKSNDLNMRRWKKIDIIEGRIGDEDLSFDNAIQMLKYNFESRLNHLDSIIKNR